MLDMLNSRVPWEFQWKHLSILRGAIRNEEMYLGVITIVMVCFVEIYKIKIKRRISRIEP